MMHFSVGFWLPEYLQMVGNVEGWYNINLWSLIDELSVLSLNKLSEIFTLNKQEGYRFF
jgi:hypothetical protein